MSDQPKNILAIISYPFLPATTGGEISTMNILNYMGKKHRVTVFTVEPYSNNFDKSRLSFELIAGMPFKASRYLNIFLIPKLVKLIKEKNIDLIFFDQPWFAWMMPLLKLFSRKKIFMRSNNIEYLRFRSMGKSWWSVMYMYEKFAYKIADLVIFVSEVDREKAIYEFDIKKKKTLLTPYGIELTGIPQKKPGARKMLEEKYNIPSNEKILLFFATMSYFPNYEAVGFIADDIYPLLKARTNFPFKILICGKNLPPNIKQKLEEKPEMTYCGFVDDIESYIDGADVMINPILSGGGVKTKAIDTLARNQTVISTRTGAEGIDSAVCDHKLIITEDHDWPAFASAIYKNTPNSGNIPLAFYERYSWVNIIEKLSGKLEKI